MGEKLRASSVPHSASQVNFDVGSYDGGAKAVFAFFIIGLVLSYHLLEVIYRNVRRIRKKMRSGETNVEGFDFESFKGESVRIVGSFCGLVVTVPLFSLCLVHLPTDYSNDTQTDFIHVSSTPHLAKYTSFAVSQYDPGAKALFGFFVLGVVVAVLCMGVLCGLGISTARRLHEEYTHHKSVQGISFKVTLRGAAPFLASSCALVLAVTFFSLCLVHLPIDPKKVAQSDNGLHVSTKPHSANELSFAVHDYGPGAQALFAFVLLGIFGTCSSMLAIVVIACCCGEQPPPPARDEEQNESDSGSEEENEEVAQEEYSAEAWDQMDTCCTRRHKQLLTAVAAMVFFVLLSVLCLIHLPVDPVKQMQRRGNLLHPSGTAHSAYDVSLDLNRYDSGAQTMFAFFFLGVVFSMGSLAAGGVFIVRKQYFSASAAGTSFGISLLVMVTCLIHLPVDPLIVRNSSLTLPMTWPNPTRIGDIKCRDSATHWTSGALYVGMEGKSECENGAVIRYQCHGGGLAAGLFHYMEGYYSWKHEPAIGQAYSLVCSGIDAAFLWSFTGPLFGCGIWQGGLNVGSYHGTWRGGGLDLRAILWGYECTRTIVTKELEGTNNFNCVCCVSSNQSISDSWERPGKHNSSEYQNVSFAVEHGGSGGGSSSSSRQWEICRLDNVVEGLSLDWRLGAERLYVRVTINRAGDHWFGLGFGAADLGMVDTDMIIGAIDSYDENGTAVPRLSDRWSAGYIGTSWKPSADEDLGGTDNVELENFTKTATSSVFTLSRPLDTKDTFDKSVLPTSAKHDLAVVLGEGRFFRVSTDMPDTRQKLKIKWDEGWRETGAKVRTTRETLLAMHGFVLLFIWSLLVVIGTGAARYFKHYSCWLSIHVTCLSVTTLMTAPLAILAMAANHGQHFTSVHSRMGGVIGLLSLVQGAVAARFHWPDQCGGALDPTTESTLRAVHRGIGRLLVLTALCNVLMGLYIMDLFDPPVGATTWGTIDSNESATFLTFIARRGYPVYLGTIVLIILHLESTRYCENKDEDEGSRSHKNEAEAANSASGDNSGGNNDDGEGDDKAEEALERSKEEKKKMEQDVTSKNPSKIVV
jgi:hypothetical protein